jgi:hypothetical protein
MVELLALVEHVLAEQPLVQAGDGDRGGVVEDPGLERVPSTLAIRFASSSAVMS